MGVLANTIEITVAWGDCDPAGIVFYPNYFRWFDEASRRLFDRAGLPWDRLFAQYSIVGVPLVSASADFRGPARYGDRLTVVSTVAEWRRASFVVTHKVATDRAIVDGQEIRAWTAGDEARPGGLVAQPVPPEVVRRFTEIAE